MDAWELILRLLPILLTIGGLGVTITIYRAGARKSELGELSKRIDGVSARGDAIAEIAKKAVDNVKADLELHKQAGDTSRADLRERMVQLEKSLEQMPSKDAVHQLAIAVTKIEGSVSTLGVSVNSIGETTKRVETFLLERK